MYCAKVELRLYVKMFVSLWLFIKIVPMDYLLIFVLTAVPLSFSFVSGSWCNAELNRVQAL